MKPHPHFLACFAGLFLFAHLLAAPLRAADNAQDQSYFPADLKVMLAVLAQVRPTPFAELPRNKNGQLISAGFFSAQRPLLPPSPGNFFGLDAWNLGEGVFVLNDKFFDYAKVEAALEAEAATNANQPQLRMMSSALNYGYGNAVYLTNLKVTNAGGMTVTFDIAGGTNVLAYDILTTTNLANPMAAWTWLGLGYTSNRYTFTNQPINTAFYLLAKPARTMTVGFGNNASGQCDVPYGLTNVQQVAGGRGQSLALKSDGTVRAWGANSSGEGVVPANLAGVAMIDAGIAFNVALLTNGTVTAWGDNTYSQTNVPSGLTNAVLISSHFYHSLALTGNGKVVAWGFNFFLGYESALVPLGLSNVTAIAAGYAHNLAVSNGYVVAWGQNNFGAAIVPAGLSNVVDVAAGLTHSLALLKNGTVVAWGGNAFGQTDVPAGLTNVVAIAAGGENSYSLALKRDGTVVTWGTGAPSAPVGGLNQVIGMAAGGDHALAIRTGPATPVIPVEPTSQYFLTAGGNVTFTTRGAGLYGVSYQWQTNGVNLPGATNATLTVTNVQPAFTNISYRCTVGNEVGTLASSNVNTGVVTPPVFTYQSPPTNPVVPYGSIFLMNATAVAPGQNNGFPISYRWLSNSVPLAQPLVSSLSQAATNVTARSYTLIASNAAGTASVFWTMATTFVGSYLEVGTLAYHLSTNAAAHTNGITSFYPTTFEFSQWTYADYHGTNLYLMTNAVWSTNFWLKGVQGLSAISLGETNGLGTAAGITMISPRHCLYAKHMHEAPAYFMFAFLDTNNIIHWRTNKENFFVTNDISIGILDADLPPSVGFLPMLPTNFGNYLPTNGYSYVQGIGRDQGARLFSQPMLFNDPAAVNWSSGISCPFGLDKIWTSALSPGDSSNPEMFLIKNQLVLVSHNYGYDGGPAHSKYLNEINRAMHYLSTNNAAATDYQLTIFPLTNWPSIH
jgi:hypothetical protein